MPQCGVAIGGLAQFRHIGADPLIGIEAAFVDHHRGQQADEGFGDGKDQMGQFRFQGPEIAFLHNLTLVQHQNAIGEV